MTKSFKEALKARRTFYQIENKSTLSDKEIRDLIRFAVEFVPSAFNSQTTRVALLTGKAHEKLWNIVKNVLRERVPAEVFGKTEEKIDGCFACGYGTILYFEDMAIVRSLQESFPTYKDNFPIWAEQPAEKYRSVPGGSHPGYGRFPLESIHQRDLPPAAARPGKCVPGNLYRVGGGFCKPHADRRFL